MATSREGINFVRSLVERNNSTFQEIDAHNDIGNDAYVEFVVEESATGCCVAVQIKSGSSYKVEGNGFVFQADRNHFEYWATHSLPVFVVFFDPLTQSSAWMDLSDYLRRHPERISEGPYVVSATEEFSEETFDAFRRHCLTYSDVYSREPNFGRALARISDRADIEACLDGLRALFSYHRHQYATWYFLVSCLRNYVGHPLLRQLVIVLCHIPGHGDIFWSRDNVIEESVRNRVAALMRELFDRKDALTMLSVIDDAGIDRGTIGQCVHTLVDTMTNTATIMESIAIDASQTERIRHSALLFTVSAAQYFSMESALAALDRIAPTIEDSELLAVVEWLRGDLRVYGRVSLY
jgi:hypothetical protein